MTEAKPVMQSVTMPEILDELAVFLQRELRGQSRNIVSFVAENETQVHPDLTKATPTKITYITPYRNAERALPLEALRPKIAIWARELATKLARPYPVEFIPMEVPKGTHEANFVETDKVWIRGVSDYSIDHDLILTRFDCLVRWMETP